MPRVFRSKRPPQELRYSRHEGVEPCIVSCGMPQYYFRRSLTARGESKPLNISKAIDELLACTRATAHAPLISPSSHCSQIASFFFSPHPASPVLCIAPSQRSVAFGASIWRAVFCTRIDIEKTPELTGRRNQIFLDDNRSLKWLTQQRHAQWV